MNQSFNQNTILTIIEYSLKCQISIPMIFKYLDYGDQNIVLDNQESINELVKKLYEVEGMQNIIDMLKNNRQIDKIVFCKEKGKIICSLMKVVLKRNNLQGFIYINEESQQLACFFRRIKCEEGLKLLMQAYQYPVYWKNIKMNFIKQQLNHKTNIPISLIFDSIHYEINDNNLNLKICKSLINYIKLQSIYLDDYQSPTKNEQQLIQQLFNQIKYKPKNHEYHSQQIQKLIQQLQYIPKYSELLEILQSIQKQSIQKSKVINLKALHKKLINFYLHYLHSNKIAYPNLIKFLTIQKEGIVQFKIFSRKVLLEYFITDPILQTITEELGSSNVLKLVENDEIQAFYNKINLSNILENTYLIHNLIQIIFENKLDIKDKLIEIFSLKQTHRLIQINLINDKNSLCNTTYELIKQLDQFVNLIRQIRQLIHVSIINHLPIPEMLEFISININKPDLFEFIISEKTKNLFELNIQFNVSINSHDIVGVTAIGKYQAESDLIQQMLQIIVQFKSQLTLRIIKVLDSNTFILFIKQLRSLHNKNQQQQASINNIYQLIQDLLIWAKSLQVYQILD